MLVAISTGMLFRVVVGIGVMYLLARIGFAMIRALAAPATTPLQPGEMRHIRAKYRCDICGVEIRMTLAPDDDPPAPNHCLEEMVFVAPTFE